MSVITAPPLPPKLRLLSHGSYQLMLTCAGAGHYRRHTPGALQIQMPDRLLEAEGVK